MATAGYIDYDPASETFTMPEEHAPALAHEGGPVFFGGVYEMLPPLVGVLDRVEEVFQERRRRPSVRISPEMVGRDGAIHPGLV